MNAEPTADDRTADVTAEAFDAALNVATERARYEFDYDDVGEVLFPEQNYKSESVTGALVTWLSPSTTVMFTAAKEPDADEVDGAAPGDDGPRSPRTFLFDAALGDDEPSEDDLAFCVVAQFTNSYDDERVVVETPAPWDTPDDMTGANEVIKSLPWGDDEAEDHETLDEGVHYTFDDDDRQAPPEAREAWALDKHGVAALKEAAEAAGYEWVVETVEAENEDEDDGETDEDALDRLAEFVEDGDEVRVRYEKKNGNGVNAYEGEVLVHEYVGPHNQKHRASGESGVVFEDTDGKTKRVRRDDDGVPAMFSNGRYPFMGEALSVEVVPSEARGLGE